MQLLTASLASFTAPEDIYVAFNSDLHRPVPPEHQAHMLRRLMGLSTDMPLLSINVCGNRICECEYRTHQKVTLPSKGVKTARYM